MEIVSIHPKEVIVKDVEVTLKLTKKEIATLVAVLGVIRESDKQRCHYTNADERLNKVDEFNFWQKIRSVLFELRGLNNDISTRRNV